MSGTVSSACVTREETASLRNVEHLIWIKDRYLLTHFSSPASSESPFPYKNKPRPTSHHALALEANIPAVLLGLLVLRTPLQAVHLVEQSPGMSLSLSPSPTHQQMSLSVPAGRCLSRRRATFSPSKPILWIDRWWSRSQRATQPSPCKPCHFASRNFPPLPGDK